jgi:hypothetical protein
MLLLGTSLAGVLRGDGRVEVERSRARSEILEGPATSRPFSFFGHPQFAQLCHPPEDEPGKFRLVRGRDPTVAPVDTIDRPADR